MKIKIQAKLINTEKIKWQIKLFNFKHACDYQYFSFINISYTTCTQHQ